MQKSIWSKIFKYIKIILLLALPITLWILPVDFFDVGNGFSLYAFLGLDEYAYSTGITRGVMHLMHFDFSKAYEYNILSFFVLPILFIFWLKFLLREFGIRILKKF